MILGVTGTRNPITDAQRKWMRDVIANVGQLHHGACVGADEESHDAAVLSDTTIVIHPPTDERLMMPRSKWFVRGGIHVMSAKPYLERNRAIVNDSDRMIALPDGPERWTGGTWYTVHYALEKAGKSVTICYPDGTIDDRLPELRS